MIPQQTLNCRCDLLDGKQQLCIFDEKDLCIKCSPCQERINDRKIKFPTIEFIMGPDES